jgi:hypothetical protein
MSRSVNDALFFLDDLTIDEIKSVLKNYHSTIKAIDVQTRVGGNPTDSLHDIEQLTKQAEEQNKRVLKRLLK